MCVDDFAVSARQCSLLAMPFDDTARRIVPHQHRSHHDISRLDVAHGTSSPGATRRLLVYNVNFSISAAFVFQILFNAFVEHDAFVR